MIDGRPVGDEVSAAGGSARARYERDLELHRLRIEPWRPWLLGAGLAAVACGLVAALLGELFVGLVIVVCVSALIVTIVVPGGDVRSWGIGADGESETARVLAPLAAEGFVVLHDRLIPGSRANIDHIVIGPPGLAVVETKSFSGRLRVKGGDVYLNGYRKTSQTVEEARREAVAVTVALAGHLECRGLTVRPILCVHRADLPFFAASPQGVPIVSGRGLVKMLRNSPPRLALQDVLELARVANDRFRPAAPRMPALDGPPVSASVPSVGSLAASPESRSGTEDESFMPPIRREQIRLAREAGARATERRTYWTRKGLQQGRAPGTLGPKGARQARRP